MSAVSGRFDRQRKASPLAALAAAATLTGMGLAGCATDRLDPNPPRGVDLSGAWQLNPSLSDDPRHPLQDDSAPPSHLRHRNGPGHGAHPGAEPGGAAEEPTDNAAPGRRGCTGDRSGGNRFGHWLDAPERMTIRQAGAGMTLRSESAGGGVHTDEITPGGPSDMPFGQGTAERTAGWRGPVFVINTRVKNGPTQEDDYALDDDGRLIVSTLLSGGHMPKVDIKRVYDRVKSSQGLRP